METSSRKGTSDDNGPVGSAEREFVENWGGLAKAFGMHRDLGRAHALIYIAREPPDDVGIASRLGIPANEAMAHVDELVDWGVVERARAAGFATYTTHPDPWVWFLKILEQRHRREFTHVVAAMRRTRDGVHGLDGADPVVQALRGRAERFTKFVEELSNLIELFLRLGQKPMTAVLRTVAKFAPKA